MTAKDKLKLLALAGLVLLTGVPVGLQAGPEKDRTLSFYHIHTKESLTVTYKRNGKYDPKVLKSINWFMRDWRNDAVIKIDPRLIDILWEMHTELGSRQPINIISAYRSRKTNNMLRRTRGGQASNSRHLYGKAIDAHFPDVSVRYVRYAALIRQRGGVGYYPTSALPFVHVDTGRVRHWPRMKRDELALLFKNGKSKHVPHGGRRIRPSDVARAKSRQTKLASLVGNYHDLRLRPKTPITVAAAGLIKPPKPQRAVRPQRPAPVASQKPAAEPEVIVARAPEPSQGLRQTLQNPTIPTPAAPSPESWTVDVTPNMRVALAKPEADQDTAASVTFQPAPSESDRARLNRLIAEATFKPLVEPPKLVRANRQTDAEEDGPKTIDDLILLQPPEPARRASNRFDWASNLIAVLDDRAWAAAPEYDDDHPDELAYRPFPIEPLLTDHPDNNPTLTRMTKPDARQTLTMLDEGGNIPPMQLRPPQQLAQVMWRQEFSGAAVELHATHDAASGNLASRSVATSKE